MAWRTPDPKALFMLVPTNIKAKELLDNPGNSPCISDVTSAKGRVGFDIGHYLSSSGDPSTLATVGRNGDIKLQGDIFSKIQCSFVIHATSKCVLFYDLSSNLSCQVYGGEHEYQFEHGRTHRRVVVRPKCNIFIGMGGEKRNILEFELFWLQKVDQIEGYIEERMNGVPPVAAHLARTIDETDTTVQSARQTRIHTGGQQFRMRFQTLKFLGSGNYGEVYKAVDMDSGDLVAVKILYRRLSQLSGPQRASVKREIEFLYQSKHRHIVEYIDAWWEDGARVHIFTNLAEGNLESLSQNPNCRYSVDSLADMVFPQMLQALDFLDAKGLVHRDVKPENILFLNANGGLTFQLTDFGFANLEDKAITSAGTPWFWAPEVCQGGKQTTKVDVWSLYATMAWLLDVEGFRGLEGNSRDAGWRAIEEIAKKNHKLSPVRAMARMDATRRASAAQILVEYYNGTGLTTARSQIPKLEDETPASQAPEPVLKRKKTVPNITRNRPPARTAGAQKLRPNSPQRKAVEDNLARPDLPGIETRPHEAFYHLAQGRQVVGDRQVAGQVPRKAPLARRQPLRLHNNLTDAADLAMLKR